MKFTSTIEIARPIQRVVQLFDDVENLKKWQDGFVSFTPISGTPGTVGAKSLIVYNSGKHVIELTETILVKNLPAEMSALYEHKHMVNTMRTRFTSLGADRTQWEVSVEYTKFIGFMPRLMAALMPGMFRKQGQKWLERFKTFAEEDGQS